MKHMRYVCPECNADGEFVEIYQETYEATGKFDEDGNINDPDPERIDCFTDRYHCLTCDEEFDKPKKVEV